MRTLTWATFPDAGSPMGLQTYETQIMRALLALEPDGWSFRRRTVGSLRSPVSSDAKVPMKVLQSGSSVSARAVGRWAYRGSGYVHRFDLRLPPAAQEVLTVHDLPPLRFTDEGSLPSWAAASARAARAVVCPSAFAAQEVRELLGVERTFVVPNGYTESPAGESLTPAERTALGVHPTRPYVLHAGGATERKNLAGLSAAWSGSPDLARDFDLVLAGPADARRDTLFASTPTVRMIGYQPRDTVARLMLDAACVVVPSMYEGFGLPAVEAMAVGTPVVAASRGALPEVCGDGALLCEPDPAGLATALRAVLAHDGLRQELRQRGRRRAASFTWEQSARQHLEVYEELFP